MWKEFKKFAAKGNVVDMAVGIIIGAAFGSVVKSLVADVIMPPIGLLLGNVDFINIFLTLKEGTTPGPYPTLADASQAGAVTINLGVFVNEILSFLIVALAVFVLVKNVNRLKARFEEEKVAAAPSTKDCPQCFTAIPIKANRCPNCTSQLSA